MKSVEVLENPIIAFLICLLALLLFGMFQPTYWVFLFLTLSSYLFCDLIIQLFVGGGHGIAQIPILGNLSQEKGHTYIAYFIGIILSTIASSWFASVLLDMVKSSTDWTTAVIALSFVVGCAVYLDMRTKFYKHKD